MPSAMWKGSLGFSLVNIPVQLYAASQEQGLSLHLLHKSDRSPVRFARVCQQDGHEVAWKDIVKGYKVGDDDYVIIDRKELEKAEARKTHLIEILNFTDENQIQERYFEKPYSLEPLKGGEKPYALLREAMHAAGKVGICRIVFTNREHLGAIKAEGSALLLNTLRFESELRPSHLTLPGPYHGSKDELALAQQLIRKMSGKFQPGRYKDSYKRELEAYIKRKSKGKAFKPDTQGEPEPTRVPDLMAALRHSLKGSAHPPSATVH